MTSIWPLPALVWGSPGLPGGANRAQRPVEGQIEPAVVIMKILEALA